MAIAGGRDNANVNLILYHYTIAFISASPTVYVITAELRTEIDSIY